MRRTFLLALGAVIAVVGMVVVPASADAVRTRTESAQAKAAPSLKVTVRGLPKGTAAAVTVKGPNRYKKPLTRTTTLKGLAPGTYWVLAKGVGLSDGAATPMSRRQSLVVKTGQSAVTVRYRGPTTPPPPPPPPPPPAGGPQVTTTAIPSGMVGVTYFASLERTPGGVSFGTGSWSWAASQAPPGLALHAANGSVFGTPTVPGTFTFTVTFTGGGYADSENVTMTVVPKPAAMTWKLLSAGIASRCGIKSDDTAWCWGLGSFGSLGNGANDDAFFPVKVAGPGTWKTLDVGGHTCGIKTDGTAWCWGWGFYGQLGNGTAGNASIPVQVSGGGTWTAISAGYTRSCGIKTDGTAWCWGIGALGDGITTDSPVPVQVLGGDDWETITAGDTGGQAGYDHSCGTKTDGSAWCWHANYWGELGNGNWGQNADSDVPVEVAGDRNWSLVSAGSRHTCGIATDASLLCWGLGADGRLGTSGLNLSALPDVVVEAGPWRSVIPGDLHTCAVKTNDTGWCWGNNGWKQLGPATTAASSGIPLQVPGAWASLDGGDYATCGINTDGKAFCWGTSFNGGLGDGSTTQTATPIPVLG